MQPSESFVIDEKLAGLRLDQAIAQVFNERSRTYATNQIKQGFVLVNGEVITKPSYRVSFEDEVELNPLPQLERKLVAENIPLEIIYEDDDLVIINKQAGLIVHPGAGNYSGTLVNALLHHFDSLSSQNISRPGIVHRLDKDTSGLLIICKNDYSHKFIAEQFLKRTVERKYYALVNGNFNEEEGKIIAPIGRDRQNRQKMSVDLVNGKEAITHFAIIKRFKNHTLIEARLETGRTHQIRVHFDYIGRPLEGDLTYGANNLHVYNAGQLLHAYELSFIHPRSKNLMKFTSELPNYFKEVLNNLKAQ